MRQVLSVKKTAGFPSWKQLKQLPSVLSRTEKRVVFGSLGLIVLSLGIIGVSYISSHRIIIPAIGGEYTEGLIGEPQFLNPLYAISSDVDQDIVSLVYSGLVRWDQQEGFIPDLAESISLNEDGTVYTLKIRENAKFHNGEDVLARDVLFTINAIQNPAYRSPLADQFYDVTVVQEDDTTVSFILKDASAPFIESLTVGILPASLWANILPQNAPLAALNLQPIGSGPYQFAEFTKDKKGSIREYRLKRNDDYYLEAPYIQQLNFKFYPDVFSLHEALQNKNIEGAGIVGFDQRESVIANKNVDLLEPFFPRETVLYFNQALSPALKDLAVRQAIAAGINKEALVSEIYQDSARVIHAQILEGMIGYDETRIDLFDTTQSKTLLDEAGYALDEETGVRLLKKSLRTQTTSDDEEATDAESTPEPVVAQTLQFTLTTVDQTDLALVAEHIQADLKAIGIDVTLNLVSPEQIATEVIDARNFELLLAPIMLEADPDPYPFWHSTQAKTSGLNLTGYSNSKVDTLLETGRTQLDENARAQTYIEFQSLLAEDVPVVYLYQSTYGYALSKKIQREVLTNILVPSDRFADITSWYLKTKKALR
ncbi:peptide ABC transporter substrate-binding protein [Candidatus Uhrbacteria bacterium]|nr:peptide ABC transporter substrate-binding protein [Candidatus Uhrbacteria bacterium]